MASRVVTSSFVSLAAALLAITALAGCGGGADGDAGDGGDGGDGGPAAGGEAVGDDGGDGELTLHFPDDLEPVCRGTGAAFATPYDPATPGIHTTVMLSGDDIDDLLETSSSLNPEWIPVFSDQSDEYAKTQLVVCALRTASSLVQECTGYESDGQPTDNVVMLYSATYQVEVRAATTAELIDSTTIEAEATDCPSFVMFDADSNTKDWYEDAYDEIIDFVKPHVVTG